MSSAVAVVSVLGVAGTVSAAPPRVSGPALANSQPQCQVNGGDDDFFPCIGPDGQAYPPKVPGSVSVQSVSTTCTTNVPKINYTVQYLNGRPATTITITIKDKDGKELYKKTGHAFSGELDFPGFSANPPDFPGWTYDPVTGTWSIDPAEQALLAELDIFIQVEDGTDAGATAQTKIGFPSQGETPGTTCAPQQSSPPPPSLSIDALAPVCIADTPYIDYKVTATGTDSTTATLTFFDLDGNQIAQYTNLGLSGRVIYPGASEDPEDWPGWKFEPSTQKWVTDPTDARWRDGLTVRVDVNPTAFGVVTYPPATEACNSPTQVAGPLPATGSDIGGPLRGAALAAATGLGLVLVARKRRSARTASAA